MTSPREEPEVNEVSEYAYEICEHLRSIEPSFMPEPGYIARHPELTWWMRSLTVNWIAELVWKSKLYPETLFLAVNVMDRALSVAKTPVPRTKLQLVAVAALMVAAKVEEITTPHLKFYIDATLDTYTRQELIEMEEEIVLALDFRLNVPGPLTFLRRISKYDNYDIPTRTVAKYLQEQALLHNDFLVYPPSTVAAASMLFARNLLEKGEWNEELQVASGGLTLSDLLDCAKALYQHVATIDPELCGVYNKYKSGKFLRASLFVEHELKKWTEDRLWV